MMAKTKHGRCGNNHFATCSVSSSDTPRPLPSPDKHKRHRTRSHHFPSPAILSALALIAATPPVVAGGPLPQPTSPPSFLCPFIERDSIDPALPSRPPIPSSSTPSPTPTPSFRRSTPGVIADRYVEGSDSSWRKTDAWTLYGSTCCTTPTTAHYRSSQTPMPTSSLATSEFDTSALPAGWDSASNTNSTTETTIILSLSIALAGTICIFIAGCVLWRRRKKRTKDIERKLGRKLDADDDPQDNAREKGSQGKMRMWAKASARWKSNIRQSARRRRKRQVPVATPSSPSRRDSFVSEKPEPSILQVDPCLDASATEPLPDPPRSASPPTYGASFVPRFSCPPTSAVPHSNSTSSPDDPRAVQCSNQPSFTEDEPLPYIPPPDGHISTDDKAQLAQLRGLASSPPPMIFDAASVNASQPVSAPQWHEVEDDLEELGVALSQVPMSFHHPDLPPSFPPPPSKSDVPSGYLADHSLNYGGGNDILASLTIPGPSGASPEASPSAPPIDDLGLEPSAPSLEDEDDLFQDWNGPSCYTPEVSVLDSTRTRTTETSVSPISFSSIQESATRDGILPRYHP